MTMPTVCPVCRRAAYNVTSPDPHEPLCAWEALEARIKQLEQDVRRLDYRTIGMEPCR